ncbi:type II toxin-antitoxin system death-on-curing family toxin [Pseudomonas aeruginosa]|uniref:type II toxin-antitoxin system death-on-curing family toxin n=1 Tax=Pseudomonas aeruginosa TaxID=287 RepID=UPI0021ADB39B|nr:type II toxin-antitoxin system death-on-curing family toxin [Pseudomonas aeruginosa]
MSQDQQGIRYLSVADLVRLNELLILAQTPDEPIGVLKPNELESAQQRPANHRYYARTDDIITLAAVFAESLAMNHCFANGNTHGGGGRYGFPPAQWHRADGARSGLRRHHGRPRDS